jgi:hypothetical protein
MKKPLYQHIALLVEARNNCLRDHAAAKEPRMLDHWREWADRHADSINELVRDHMPSGSGVDTGTKFGEDSKPDRLVFRCSFHHMDEFGGYDGWTDHDIIATPSLARGFELRITGRDRNEIKDYLSDLYVSALSAEIER